MIFLKDQKDPETAVKNLNAHKDDLRIQDIIYGEHQIDIGMVTQRRTQALPCHLFTDIV